MVMEGNREHGFEGMDWCWCKKGKSQDKLDYGDNLYYVLLT
jgi:hypothetical protein